MKGPISIRRRGVLLLLLLWVWTPIVSGQSVVGIRARTEPGQTVLTWRVQGGRCDGYVIYSSTHPIRNSLHLRLSRRLGFLARGQAINERMSSILKKTVTYTLPGTNQPLQARDEFAVLPTSRQSRVYYAIVPVVGGSEAPLFRVGDNTMNVAVSEKPGIPQPTFQGRVSWQNRAVDLYVHWGFSDSLPGYPAMTNEFSYPFNFALCKNGGGEAHPLLVNLHSRGAHLLRTIHGSGNPSEWILSLDDYLPGKLRNTFWFGYHSTLYIRGKPVVFPSNDVVEDYTARRVAWTVQWVCGTFPVDPERVTLSGFSMGGSGAIFLGYSYPSLFAAIRAMMPRLNYSVETDPNLSKGSMAWQGSRNLFAHLWGRPEGRPRVRNGLPVYLRLNLGEYVNFLETPELPYAMIISGRKDTTVGWFQNLGVFPQMEALHLGFSWVWDMREHEPPSAREPGSVESLMQISRYRAQRSFPAVTELSSNADPGRGLVSEGDSLGQWNAQVDWLGPVVDEPNLWSVTLIKREIVLSEKVLPVPDTVICTLTPKRIQKFKVLPGRTYECRIIKENQVLEIRTMKPDKRRELIIPNLRISNALLVEIRPKSS